MSDSPVLAAINEVRLAIGAGFAAVLAALGALTTRIGDLAAAIQGERETHADEMANRDAAAEKQAAALRALAEEVAELRGKVTPAPARHSLDALPGIAAQLGKLGPDAQRTIRWAIVAGALASPVLVLVVRGYDRILTALLGAP